MFFGMIPYVGLPLFSFVLFYVLLSFAHVFGLWIGRVKEILEGEEEGEDGEDEV